VSAVKNGRVYVNGGGLMHWDYGSEGILLMEYMAKTLHPDLFTDLDMKTEVKEFYLKFYNYSLTDEQADRILRSLPPA
jgi:iron complex transport system substrate-binding protein